MKYLFFIVAAVLSLGLFLPTPAPGQIAGSRFETRVPGTSPADFVVSIDSVMARLAVKRAVIALDKDWKTGRMENNTGLLDSLLADDWTSSGTGAGSPYLGGLVQSKAQYLAGVKSGQRSYESIDDEPGGVRIWGDTAVLIGRTTSRGYLDDELIVGTSQFTRTYARRAGRWQMISSRAALILPL